jgi:hypothetical protein
MTAMTESRHAFVTASAAPSFMIESLGESAATMRVLYVIFVLCVTALLFTALAAARHIRRHEKRRKPPANEKTASEKPALRGEMSSNSEILVPAGKARGN